MSASQDAASRRRAKTSLVDFVVDELLERIVRGELKAGKTIPPEAQIAEQLSVSRLTAREAINVLRAQNIVSVRRGTGTFVNAPGRWTGLAASLRAAAYGIGEDETSLRLLEVRRMVETGSAELAAVHRSQADVERMGEEIACMEEAHRRADGGALTVHDLAFHEAIFTASRNPFVPAIMGQLGDLLYSMRRRTSEHPEVQRHAIEHHKIIRDAISAQDAYGAKTAMERHIDQTFEDYVRLIRSNANGRDQEIAPA